MRIPRPRLARRTARLRLTLLYGAVFVAGGAAEFTVTYLLVSHTANPARPPGRIPPVTTGITAHQLKAMKMQGVSRCTPPTWNYC
jgi:hypothetical protein